MTKNGIPPLASGGALRVPPLTNGGFWSSADRHNFFTEKSRSDFSRRPKGGRLNVFGKIAKRFFPPAEGRPLLIILFTAGRRPAVRRARRASPFYMFRKNREAIFPRKNFFFPLAPPQTWWCLGVLRSATSDSWAHQQDKFVGGKGGGAKNLKIKN